VNQVQEVKLILDDAANPSQGHFALRLTIPDHVAAHARSGWVGGGQGGVGALGTPSWPRQAETGPLFSSTVAMAADEASDPLAHHYRHGGHEPGTREGESLEARIMALPNWRALGPDARVSVTRKVDPNTLTTLSTNTTASVWVVTFFNCPSWLPLLEVLHTPFSAPFVSQLPSGTRWGLEPGSRFDLGHRLHNLLQSEHGATAGAPLSVLDTGVLLGAEDVSELAERFQLTDDAILEAALWVHRSSAAPSSSASSASAGTTAGTTQHFIATVGGGSAAPAAGQETTGLRFANRGGRVGFRCRQGCHGGRVRR
jgi:hypothetical protein